MTLRVANTICGPPPVPPAGRGAAGLGLLPRRRAARRGATHPLRPPRAPRCPRASAWALTGSPPSSGRSVAGPAPPVRLPQQGGVLFGPWPPQQPVGLPPPLDFPRLAPIRAVPHPVARHHVPQAAPQQPPPVFEQQQ